MVGRRPARAVRGGGRARNAKFVQRPYGAGRGPGSGVRAGKAASRAGMVGVRAGRAWLAVLAGRGIGFPCKDPMERGVGQQGRDGRVRTGRHGWRLWGSTECDFAQRPYALGSGALGSWGAGHWGAGQWEAGQWEAGRKGQVQTGGGGWRLWPGTECEIRAKTLWSGSRRRGPGWPAFGRAAQPTVVAGRGMRFPCKDPRVKRPRACLMDRGAGLGDWAGRVRTGRRGRQTGAVPRRVAGARLAGTNAMNVKNSAATPYNSLPPGHDPVVGTGSVGDLGGRNAAVPAKEAQRHSSDNDTVQIRS
jgi:hypothetical protein